MPTRRGEQFGTWTSTKSAASLPATTSATLFSVTGTVKVLSIRGKVTTAIQDQACTLLVRANDGTNTQNLCAATSVRNNGVGVFFAPSGTLTSAAATSIAAGVYQAAPVVVGAGTIQATTNATNTGAMEWIVEYQPIDPGAQIN